MTDTTVRETPAVAPAPATAKPAGPLGARVERREDVRFLIGAAQYTDDVTLAGQTHAYFLRSPHAHARIRSISTAAAQAAPGVSREALAGIRLPASELQSDMHAGAEYRAHLVTVMAQRAVKAA